MNKVWRIAAVMAAFLLGILAATVKVGTGSVLSREYDAPLETDPQTLVQQSMEVDGLPYDFLSVESETVPGVQDSREIRQSIVVQTSTTDRYEILQNHSLEVQYDKDGYEGTLLLAEVWVDDTPGAVTQASTMVMLSGPGDEQEESDPQPSYSATLVYEGVISKTEPGHLHITARYRQSATPLRYAGAWMRTLKKDASSMEAGQLVKKYWYLPAAALALLAAGMVGWAVRINRKKETVEESMKVIEPRDDRTVRPEKRMEKPQAPATPMKRPAFLENMDRSGRE